MPKARCFHGNRSIEVQGEAVTFDGAMQEPEIIISAPDSISVEGADSDLQRSAAGTVDPKPPH